MSQSPASTSRSRPQTARRSAPPRANRRWLWVVLLLLVLLPLGASTQHFGLRGAGWAAGILLLVSGLTYVAYRADKQRARRGEWRVSEFALQSWAILGGWPGAFLAQQTLRHKNAKTSFQTIFWTIVLVHQAVALDAILGWRGLRAIVEALPLDRL